MDGEERTVDNKMYGENDFATDELEYNDVYKGSNENDYATVRMDHDYHYVRY